MSRDRRLLVAALCAVLATPAASAAPAAAVPPTCHGQPATIVGERGDSVDGTDGPDVIVVNGANEVAARGGDDLVCSASTDNGSEVGIYAGEGDDVVDTSRNVGISSSVDLGPGDDTYTGGDEVDVVLQDIAPAPGAGTDVISTGGGNDLVGTGGDPETPDADTIDLGPGDDSLSVSGTVAPADWRGGPGADHLTWESFRAPGAYVIDNARGRATHDGADIAAWSSFGSFDFFAGAARDVRFVGSDGAEVVRTLVALDEVRLGGGNDVLRLAAEDLARAAAMRLYGGRGDDLLQAGADYTSGSVDLQLGPGTLRFVRPGQTGATSTVRGFDRAHAVASWVRMIGTSGPDRLRWNACSGQVLGAAGADVLTYLTVQENTCRAGGDLVANGGPGPDVLVGGYLADRLVGGLGRDSADGRAGRDLCRAETQVRCER
jgi:D-alanyl-D-alanine carboxypeptidase